LAYRFGTDKSKDDHKYVDVYDALLDHLSDKVRNVTEVGLAAGQSIAMWAAFFPKAHVWGIDKRVRKEVRTRFATEPRVHLLEFNAYSTWPHRHGLADSTMDLVIDDALHMPWAMEAALERYWPLVRPGGYYVIEDIGPELSHTRAHGWQLGTELMLSNASRVSAKTRAIIEGSNAFFVNAAFGRRNSSSWGLGGEASFMAVLRKRTRLMRPFKSNADTAMHIGGVELKGMAG